jgi:hypothetical protein
MVAQSDSKVKSDFVSKLHLTLEADGITIRVMSKRLKESSEQQAEAMMEKWGIRALEEPHFLAGEAARILGVTTGRLQKYVLRYELSPAEHLGKKGQGSRRVFSKKDLYRLAVAGRLVGDGFVPNFVERALHAIGDEELLGMDSESNPRPQCVVFRRVKKGRTEERQIGFFESGGPPSVTPETPEYYVLDLSALTGEIDRRIAAVKGNK